MEEKSVSKEWNTGYVQLECSSEEDHSDSNSEAEEQEFSQLKEPRTNFMAVNKRMKKA